MQALFDYSQFSPNDTGKHKRLRTDIPHGYWNVMKTGPNYGDYL
jgi:hypothetical protein